MLWTLSSVKISMTIFNILHVENATFCWGRLKGVFKYTVRLSPAHATNLRHDYNTNRLVSCRKPVTVRSINPFLLRHPCCRFSPHNINTNQRHRKNLSALLARIWKDAKLSPKVLYTFWLFPRSDIVRQSTVPMTTAELFKPFDSSDLKKNAHILSCDWWLKTMTVQTANEGEFQSFRLRGFAVFYCLRMPNDRT